MKIIQKRTGDRILDCFVNIMDEVRPQPMRNYRPAQKTKNGADRFWDTHQEHYEARGKRSGSRVGRVKRHNTAYPKLIDELHKRHSTSKITTSNSKWSSLRTCNERVKSKKSKTNRKSRRSMLSTRIYKHRPTRNRTKTLEFMTRGCQCAYVLVKDKKIGAESSGILKMESKLDIDSDMRAKAPHTPNSGASKPQSKSGHSSKYPDTSIASISSFNSYATLGEEPMV